MNYRDVLRMNDLNILMLMDDLGKAKRDFAYVNLLPDAYVRRGVLQGGPIIPCPDGPWESSSNNSMYEVGYQTGSGNRMSLLVHMFSVDRDNVPLLTEWEQVSFCGDCKGSSGGCPGFAPRFEWMRKSYGQFVVVAVSIDFIWAIMYATPKDGWIGNRVIKQLVYTDRLTENYCNRMLKHIRQSGYQTLGLGNCAGCRPKQCTVIRGGKCKFPKKRTFSMEAVGVDCDALHMRFYDECLPWYYKGTSKMPTYMTRYVGAFVGDGISEFDKLDSVTHEFVASDKSCIPIDGVPEPREATVSLQEILTGQHKGDFQYIYNDPGLLQV